MTTFGVLSIRHRRVFGKGRKLAPTGLFRGLGHVWAAAVSGEETAFFRQLRGRAETDFGLLRIGVSAAFFRHSRRLFTAILAVVAPVRSWLLLGLLWLFQRGSLVKGVSLRRFLSLGIRGNIWHLALSIS